MKKVKKYDSAAGAAVLGFVILNTYILYKLADVYLWLIDLMLKLDSSVQSSSMVDYSADYMYAQGALLSFASCYDYAVRFY